LIFFESAKKFEMSKKVFLNKKKQDIFLPERDQSQFTAGACIIKLFYTGSVAQ
jgi:hypothetical protein